MTLLSWPITKSNVLQKGKNQRCWFRLQTEFRRLKDVPLSYANTQVNEVQPYATALWKIRSTHSYISFFKFSMAPKCSRDIIKTYMKPKYFINLSLCLSNSNEQSNQAQENPALSESKAKTQIRCPGFCTVFQSWHFSMTPEPNPDSSLPRKQTSMWQKLHVWSSLLIWPGLCTSY